ncbi:hypothetical protein N2152v2_000206 [Parachlorella kessleri]
MTGWSQPVSRQPGGGHAAPDVLFIPRGSWRSGARPLLRTQAGWKQGGQAWRHPGRGEEQQQQPPAPRMKFLSAMPGSSTHSGSGSLRGSSGEGSSSSSSSSSSSANAEPGMAPGESKEQLPPGPAEFLSSSDTEQLEPPSRRSRDNLHPLQRIALDVLGRLAALVPPWMRALIIPPYARRIAGLLLAFAVGAFASLGAHMHARRVAPPPPQEVVYSEFVRLVESGNVRAARFEEGSSSSRILFDLRPHSSATGGRLAGDASGGSAAGQGMPSAASSSSEVATIAAVRRRSPTPRQFYTYRMGGVTGEAALMQSLLAAGVEFGVIKASLSQSFARILLSAIAVWIPLLPLMLLMRRMLDERMGGGRKKSKNSGKDVPKTTFADVAGVGPAKEELAEFVPEAKRAVLRRLPPVDLRGSVLCLGAWWFGLSSSMPGEALGLDPPKGELAGSAVVSLLRNGARYQRLGAKMPGGVLLCGPPGTGKTLLARAVAGEAGVPFFAASASEFVELFVGRGAARIRELFAEARKKAPCVVFIDELDAVGGKRGIGLNEERDQTLNQLLTELDGFEGRPGVLLLAATNRPDVLDEALVRPGRLSRKVVVPLPDEAGRADILRVHIRGVPLAEDPDATCATLAKATAGFSGAELANVINEAALLSVRRGCEAVSLPELLEAVYRTRYGVNGGGSPLPLGAALQKRLTSWLVDINSSNKQQRGLAGS